MHHFDHQSICYLSIFFLILSSAIKCKQAGGWSKWTGTKEVDVVPWSCSREEQAGLQDTRGLLRAAALDTETENIMYLRPQSPSKLLDPTYISSHITSPSTSHSGLCWPPCPRNTPLCVVIHTTVFVRTLSSLSFLLSFQNLASFHFQEAFPDTSWPPPPSPSSGLKCLLHSVELNKCHMIAY